MSRKLRVEDLVVTDELIDKFFQFIESGPDGHVLWRGPVFPKGTLAAFPAVGSYKVSARRFAYHAFVEKIDSARRIYPTCPENLCVNPAHATVVSNKTCRKGHPKIFYESLGRYICPTCRQDNKARQRASWVEQAELYIGTDRQRFRSGGL